MRSYCQNELFFPLPTYVNFQVKFHEGSPYTRVLKFCRININHKWHQTSSVLSSCSKKCFYGTPYCSPLDPRLFFYAFFLQYAIVMYAYSLKKGFIPLDFFRLFYKSPFSCMIIRMIEEMDIS